MQNADANNVPRHIAIIMDGNGRWAKRHNLDRSQGHIEGVKRVEEIVDNAEAMGVKVLTLFTFSTENWTRPRQEVSMLMTILVTVIQRKIKKLSENNMRFRTIGRWDGVPDVVKNALQGAIEETKNNTGLVINLAFNYGSRLEIVDAIKKIVTAVEGGQLKKEDIDEGTVSRALYTDGLPDPDLLIRTSGEKRISNFLLWQLSYTEFYFTDKCWPEFDLDEFKKAIADYQSRERRFGNIITGEN